MKKLVLHIGMHKTGTTSIQDALAIHRSMLEGAGVLYPKSGIIGGEGHHNLVYEVCSPWKFNKSAGGWRELSDEVDVHADKDVLISSESFSGYYANSALLNKVREFSIEKKMKLVICLAMRPQMSYFESLYSQNSATGYNALRFHECFMEAVSNERLNYKSLINAWASICNFESIHVVPFPPVDGSMIGSLFNLLGLEEPKLSLKSLNVRRGAKATEYGRALCEILLANRVKRPTIVKTVKRFADYVALSVPNDKKFVASDERLVDFANAIFQADNAWIGQTFGFDAALLKSSANNGDSTLLYIDDSPAIRIQFERQLAGFLLTSAKE